MEAILPLLKRGVGIHHSGLLPLLKEVIEILFGEGLIKALFATETFSMGLNMPAKTVIFASVRKFDGQTFRAVSSGEYIQMSGRAGRRGLDDRGIVIQMMDEKLEPAVCKEMLLGHADYMNSSFHLSYNMLLNCMRVETADVEQMIQKSFLQFQMEKEVPGLLKQQEELQAQHDSIVLEKEEVVAEYHMTQQSYIRLKDEMRSIVDDPLHVTPYLQTGRLAKVRDGETDWGWGIIINFRKKEAKGAFKQGPKDKALKGAEVTVDLLLPCKPGGEGGGGGGALNGSWQPWVEAKDPTADPQVLGMH